MLYIVTWKEAGLKRTYCFCGKEALSIVGALVKKNL